MGSPGSTRPTPTQNFAGGALTGYILGPQDLGPSKATDASNLFSGGAGSLPGSILPNYADLTNQAGQTFFGGLNGQNANPIFTNALNTAFNTPDINIDMGGMGGGFGGGGGFGAGSQGFGQTVIPSSYTNQALDYLSNTPSAFDTMTGGPMVDAINQRVDQASQAYTNRAFDNMDIALEKALSNDMATGLLSGSTIATNRGMIAKQVVDDIATMDATLSLDSTKYLGDLAMQDVVNQSNNMQAILQQALVEKGINAQFAATMASNAANNAKDLAIAKLNAQTQLTLNSQDNALQLLGLGQQDFQNAQQNQMQLGLAPLTMLGNLATGGPSITQGAKSA